MLTVGFLYAGEEGGIKCAQETCHIYYLTVVWYKDRAE